MEESYKKDILRNSQQLMMYFGSFTLMLCLLIEYIIDGIYDLSLFLIAIVFICDILLVYLSHNNLKILLESIH